MEFISLAELWYNTGRWIGIGRQRPDWEWFVLEYKGLAGTSLGAFVILLNRISSSSRPEDHAARIYLIRKQAMENNQALFLKAHQFSHVAARAVRHVDRETIVRSLNALAEMTWLS